MADVDRYTRGRPESDRCSSVAFRGAQVLRGGLFASGAAFLAACGVRRPPIGVPRPASAAAQQLRRRPQHRRQQSHGTVGLGDTRR